METQHLQIFLAVAADGSVTEAAEIFVASQPSVIWTIPSSDWPLLRGGCSFRRRAGPYDVLRGTRGVRQDDCGRQGAYPADCNHSAIRTDLIPATLAKFSPSDLPLDMHIAQFLSSIIAGQLLGIEADDPVMQLAQGAEGLSEPLATVARHVDLVTVTPEQYEVLAVMPSAKRVSEHLLMLALEPENCLARTILLNAIMYPEGRLDRADLELGALGTSLVNGCKYRAAVHARRHSDLSKAPSRSARPARLVGCAAVLITLAMAVPVFACSRLLGSTFAHSDSNKIPSCETW